MKRYDITIKAQLRKAGIKVIKWNRNRVSEEGVDLTQDFGVVSINARGMYTKEEILNAIDVDCELYIANAKQVEEVQVADEPKQELGTTTIRSEFAKTITELQGKVAKDMNIVKTELVKLNRITAHYNITLTLNPGPRGIFAEDELHYIVTTTERRHIRINHVEMFGIEAQNMLDDIYAMLTQISNTQNVVNKLRHEQWKMSDKTQQLINELRLKGRNYVSHITFQMVKQNICATLKQAQDVVKYLFNNNLIEITDKVHTNNGIKVYVQVTPIIEIDDNEANLEYC